MPRDLCGQCGQEYGLRDKVAELDQAVSLMWRTLAALSKSAVAHGDRREAKDTCEDVVQLLGRMPGE